MSVRFALLGFLAQRPRHGYELRMAFEALVGGDENWDLKPAQVYTTLERLEGAGLVGKQLSAQGRVPEKQVYTITERGRESLREWFAEGVASKHGQDEFFIKLMACLMSGEADPAALIQTQRTQVFRQLHDAIALRDGYDPRSEMAQILLLEKAVMHHEADLRWLDITEQRLEEVKKQPLPEPEKRPRGRPRKEGKHT
jgi:DNA-binding PadR family transcriptional regulator